MRAMKFRAWDPEMQEMHAVNQITFDQSCHMKYGRHILDGHNDIHLLSNVVLMQYTGITDKNVKEIYEGDIVTGRVSTNPNRVCEGLKIQNAMGKRLTGTIDYSDFYGRFFFTSDGITFLSLNDGISSIEVIGNIYENTSIY